MLDLYGYPFHHRSIKVHSQNGGLRFQDLVIRIPHLNCHYTEKCGRTIFSTGHF